jgi:flagellar hook protein FlgE
MIAGVTSASTAAAQGLLVEQRRMNQAAHEVATMDIERDAGGPTRGANAKNPVDLARATVDQITAATASKADIKVIQTHDAMQRALLGL